YVRMPEYRWGIFLAEPEPARVISFGDHKGQPVWQDVPGEYRGVLRRLIVTQGDTEPASVEQQRHLGRTCPSLYDLRNLFQVNVEEGRHLWAMVYLLDAYFGRDGREESEGLLQRRSGDRDKPRLLGAFNEKTPHWLAYLMFTYFTGRDGKYQLASLAESGFEPLSRTCRFMLTEEAHHMFVGETGVGRVVQRTCELMRQWKTDEVQKYGAIGLPTLQKYVNFHYSVSLDLFGSEVSTNAANFYTLGLKGRFEETKKSDDHQLKQATYPVTELREERMTVREQPALPSLNERLRDDYIADCQRGVDRWNRVIKEHGMEARAGELVVVAGQVGARRASELAGPDVESQTKQAFANVRSVVEAAGCSMKDVIRLQTFLISADDIEGFMKARHEVFSTYFPDGTYPPNTLLVVGRLVRPELRVEIEAMAVRPRAATRRKPAPGRKVRR